MNVKYKKTINKQGFTLVELSIVIIIIGFLIAGVTAGQSLIESAKLNSVISEMTQLQRAYNTFRARFDAIPGDMSNAASYWPNCTPYEVGWCRGDGNGVIQKSRYWPVWGTSLYHEDFLAFRHLYLAGMINNAGLDTLIYSGYSDYSNIGNTDNGAFPASSFSGATYYFSGMVFPFWQSSGGLNPFYRSGQGITDVPNVLFVMATFPHGRQGPLGSGWNFSILTATQAIAIDLKADDGNIKTGDWRAIPDALNCFLPDCPGWNSSGTDLDMTYTKPAALVARVLDPQ